MKDHFFSFSEDSTSSFKCKFWVEGDEKNLVSRNKYWNILSVLEQQLKVFCVELQQMYLETVLLKYCLLKWSFKLYNVSVPMFLHLSIIYTDWNECRENELKEKEVDATKVVQAYILLYDRKLFIHVDVSHWNISLDSYYMKFLKKVHLNGKICLIKPERSTTYCNTL